ncbi:hypothetical protein M3B92_08655 [Brevibacterium casei]|uniref:Uncharacterized protein n=2 Tax=Brevibacterium TaxID=1696 RepID=A0A269ZHV0_9MICO|nr:hypothetical protein [Brevibacterium casei]MCT1766180.1 hypothetical protein [Brevibacterium casei]MDH5149667.1 hypothetical protein [Brevibacterium casei]PAK97060.1 hypothetical protein B8X04_00305 [Brevibacterium casei]
MSEDRIPMPEQPEPKKFNAPLWAGAVVVVGLIIVLLVNVFGDKDTLTVDDLNPPAVAALDGGSEVYPPNSELAFTENVKFGYLPAPTLTTLDDGTVVAADPETAAETLGLPDGLGGLTVDEFEDRTIKPPREGTEPGTPMTWQQVLDAVAGSTVVVPLIPDTATAEPALAAIAKADMAASTIVRTADAEVARAAADAGIAAMFVGDPTATAETELADQGYTMVAVDAADAGDWTDSGLGVWATGVADKKQLDELASQGVIGALATNPYAVLPSTVKTN